MMLVLSRRRGESILVGDDIRIRVDGIDAETGSVRFDVEVPPGVYVSRERTAEKGASHEDRGLERGGAGSAGRSA